MEINSTEDIRDKDFIKKHVGQFRSSSHTLSLNKMAMIPIGQQQKIKTITDIIHVEAVLGA